MNNLDFESDILTAHLSMTEHMPEILTKMYKDLGIKFNSEDLSNNVKEVFTKNMEGQNPAECLLITLYILRELYRQFQNDTVNERDVSPEFLKIIGKQKTIAGYQ